MAGVIFGLTMRRDVWARHKISPFEIPESIKVVALQTKDKMKGGDLPE
jgi:hypothetical protein